MFLGKARVQGVRKAGVLWLDYRTNEGPSLDGFFTGVTYMSHTIERQAFSKTSWALVNRACSSSPTC